MSDAYDEASERFLGYLQDQRRLSEQTVRAYACDLRQFGEYLRERADDGVAPGPEGIDSLAVRGFIAQL